MELVSAMINIESVGFFLKRKNLKTLSYTDYFFGVFVFVSMYSYDLNVCTAFKRNYFLLTKGWFIIDDR